MYAGSSRSQGKGFKKNILCIKSLLKDNEVEVLIEPYTLYID